MKYCDHQRNKRNWTQPKYNKHKKSMKYCNHQRNRRNWTQPKYNKHKKSYEYIVFTQIRKIKL